MQLSNWPRRPLIQILCFSLLFFVTICSLCSVGIARSDDGNALLLNIKGSIGPATSDYVKRGLEKAQDERFSVVILKLDTPGGLDYSMREIVKNILSSKIPVVSYVAPSGARAASAGTYIMYASHIAAMAPATTLGAATPVKIGGFPGFPDGKDDTPEREKDKNNKNGERRDNDGSSDEKPQEDQSQGTMNRKIVNDAAAYIRSLAKRHGRNEEWAELAVRRAVSLTAEEALEQNVIDVVASSIADLLAQINGKRVRLGDKNVDMHTDGLVISVYEPDWRNQLLSTITDPNVAYILMLIGVYGLIFELANPGSIFPGVAGAISLLLALYAFQVLPINYAGLGLMILGIMFMIAEAFMPSFGVLGLGGIIAFVVGSIILLGEEQLSISLPLIGGTALVSAGFFMWVIGKLIRVRKRQIVSGAEQMVGLTGYALEDFEELGRIRVHSETWKAHSRIPLVKGQSIRVVSMNGLLLTVEPLERNSSD